MNYFKSFLLVVMGSCLAAPRLLAQDVMEALTREQEAQTGTAITIIFDDSGSMSQNRKMRQAKAAFQHWLQGPAASRYSLITFKNGGIVQVPLASGTREEVATKVATLRPAFGTPIANCLKLAHQQIQRHRAEVSPYERHIVLVFTDGAESVAKTGNQAVLANIKAIVRDGQGTEVVGIGFQGEGEYMAQAATAFFAATNTEDLVQSLNKVAAEVDAQAELELTPQEQEKMRTMDFGAAVKQIAAPDGASLVDMLTAPNSMTGSINVNANFPVDGRTDKGGTLLTIFVVGIAAMFVKVMLSAKKAAK